VIFFNDCHHREIQTRFERLNFLAATHKAPRSLPPLKSPLASWRLFLHASLLLTASVSFAEPAVNESLLGMTEQALKDLLPAVDKVSKPIHGPHGERGLWVLKNSPGTGQNSEVTFYFKARLLRRIEQRWISLGNSCDTPYATLIQNLNSSYGSAIQSDDGDLTQGQGQSAAWIAEKFKVMAYKINYPNHCDLLVAFEPHQTIDASQL
jgi:hypothetical protein